MTPEKLIAVQKQATIDIEIIMKRIGVSVLEAYECKLPELTELRPMEQGDVIADQVVWYPERKSKPFWVIAKDRPRVGVEFNILKFMGTDNAMHDMRGAYVRRTS